jgi:putative ATP-binding cassette transporter
MKALNESESKIESAPKDVFFLPQKPYNLLGTLREQIMYPAVGALSDDTETGTVAEIREKIRTQELDKTLLEILTIVKLDTLAARMGGSSGPLEGLSVFSDWSKVLSLGEHIYIYIHIYICIHMYIYV